MATRPVEIRYKGKLLRTGEIGAAIKELPRAIRGKALLHVAKFMLKRYMLYPRYNYKSRARAYGSTGAKFENGNPVPDGYFSAKQFRYVAAITKGFTQRGPHRTQDLKRGWHIQSKGGELSKLLIVNSQPAAVFAYHPIYQARQLGLVGWKNINDMTDENQDDAFLDLEVFIYNEFPKEFDRQMAKA